MFFRTCSFDNKSSVGDLELGCRVCISLLRHGEAKAKGSGFRVCRDGVWDFELRV